MRGTVSRAELRQVMAATYHQVWWPSTYEVRFEGDYLPVRYQARGGYLDPASGELLPTWDEALDAIGPTMSRGMWSGSGPNSPAAQGTASLFCSRHMPDASTATNSHRTLASMTRPWTGTTDDR
jgi:hypothetical protein